MRLRGSGVLLLVLSACATQEPDRYEQLSVPLSPLVTPRPVVLPTPVALPPPIPVVVHPEDEPTPKPAPEAEREVPQKVPPPVVTEKDRPEC